MKKKIAIKLYDFSFTKCQSLGRSFVSIVVEFLRLKNWILLQCFVFQIDFNKYSLISMTFSDNLSIYNLTSEAFFDILSYCIFLFSYVDDIFMGCDMSNRATYLTFLILNHKRGCGFIFVQVRFCILNREVKYSRGIQVNKDNCI